MSNEHKPSGAGLIERFRNQHVAVRWGALALIAMVAWLLITAI
jgi:hypothetical protein